MITHCPKCKTELVEAIGIGPYCPNKECDIVDGPAVCLNCKHSKWMVAIGRGVECGHPDVEEESRKVPNRYFSCLKWEEN
jgi:hypothetical protein